ncbi:MAG: ammonium transporter [Neomegalonema sp.]|nr:ammonium transporter [Neomegalonema sp.]
MEAANIAWLLTATALVLFMTLPGLALFYGGLVRSRNVLSVLMQCFAIAASASLLWFAFGYSIAFGGEGAFWGGLGKAFLLNMDRDPTAEGGAMKATELLTALFQMTFAIITPALIIGAIVERARFGFVVLFSSLWMLLCYAPVAHWVWGGGFLSAESGLSIFKGVGVQDLAGGVVVHVTAGVAALVLVAVIGPRAGFPHELKPPHQPVLVMIGAAMLWVGWFGFNGGSPAAANNSAVLAALVTHLSAAAACASWALWERLRFGKATLIGIVTGMVAGLASITPAAGHVGPIGAVIIGGVAGVLCQEMIGVVKNRMKLDDSLDVFAVHGVGGIWGTLALPFLAAASLGGAGLGEASVMAQFAAQLVGVLIVALFTGVVTLIVALIAKKLVGARSSDEDIADGLDLADHGERAYELT